MQASNSIVAAAGAETVHPLHPEDAAIVSAMRAAVLPRKSLARGIEGREPFNALMESVAAREDLEFEAGSVGGVPGLWVHPAQHRAGEAILHLHAGWFMLGSARTFRHLAGQVAARTRASTFIPDYRLAPEHPFPAAVEDVLASYRGLGEMGFRRVAVSGDSAGGNLALVLASRVSSEAVSFQSTLVVVASASPVTDLTLSGASYETRAEADPLFTRPQVVDLVGQYLKGADAKHPLASPLHGPVTGLPPIRIHVGDAEMLLDDSRRYVERARAAGVDARLDVWLGMPHGFTGSVGKLRAATSALDSMGAFLAESLRAGT